MPDCCKKKDNEKGFSKGILYGLIPHVGCLMFLIFTVLGITALSAILKPMLLNSYFFDLLIVFSLVLTTLSAVIYLKRASLFSLHGIKLKWKYLFTLYGTTIAVNLLLFLVVFPYAANFNFNYPAESASIGISQAAIKKITLEVDIPCFGHAPLVIGELKNNAGIRDVKFRLPNVFDIYYDSSKISEKEILLFKIFKDFKPKVLTG